MTDWLWLVLCGLTSGFLAGLLGIGGGFVVVPAMLLLIPPSVAPLDRLPQMAVATSLAAMIPTTVAALVAQWRRGAVDVHWLRRLGPGVCLGAIAGAMLLPHIAAQAVAAIFLVYAVYFALRLLLAPHGVRLPTPWVRWPVWVLATTIGGISVLAGVGGAIFTVPYLESRELRMTSATATSSGVGLLLSLVAVVLFAGKALWLAGNAYSVDWVWWSGAAIIGAVAMLSAPLGVKAAHHAPVAVLKRAFALLLVCAAGSAIWKLQAL